MRHDADGAPTILVPTDFSAGSRAALEEARELERKVGAEIVLVHVLDTSGLYVPRYVHCHVEDLAGPLRADAEARLRALASEAGVARFEVLEGQPAPAICQAARRLPADLIVIATHGRTGLTRLFLGSVAELVVRTAPCNVLVVRSAAARAPEGEAEAACAAAAAQTGARAPRRDLDEEC
jgi:nucleotide-binding universal stress UspA family protein